MAEILRSNPIAVRHCILYDFLGEMPIFEAYKNLCKKLGDDVMDYNEFDFWYMRFASRNFNLNYDRSVDPKPRPLLEMPADILTKIINEFDVMDRLLTRKVCLNLQTLIDDWNPGFKELSIVINDNSSLLRIDENRINYNNSNRYHKELKKDNCIVEYKENRAVINKANHAKLSTEDFVGVLKNPNSNWEEISVNSLTDIFHKNMRSKLKSSDRKIRVKSVKFITAFDGEEMAILPYLEPGTLENINLDVISMRKELQLEEIKTRIHRIGQLEQCREAKMLTFVTGLNSHSFPIKSFLHYPRFTITFWEIIGVRTVMRFKKVLLTSADLRLFNLTTRHKFDVKAIKERLDKGSIGVPNRPNVRRFPIPNSDEFFEIEVDDYSIRIERTL